MGINPVQSRLDRLQILGSVESASASESGSVSLGICNVVDTVASLLRSVVISPRSGHTKRDSFFLFHFLDFTTHLLPTACPDDHLRYYQVRPSLRQRRSWASQPQSRTH